jgi:hypothetical protein
MADEKVYSPTIIEENPFPGEAEVFLPTATGSKDVLSPNTTKPKNMPVKRTAVELLSSALNTRSKKVLGNFELVGSGGFQIGKYENGVSGDVRLTPNGLTARNAAGNTTIALDGDTGDAVFAGQIQSGSVITGEVKIGNNRLILTVSADGQPQIFMNDGTTDRLLIGWEPD